MSASDLRKLVTCGSQQLVEQDLIDSVHRNLLTQPWFCLYLAWGFAFVVCLVLFWGTASQSFVFQAVPELSINCLASSSQWSSCLRIPGARNIGMFHAWLWPKLSNSSYLLGPVSKRHKSTCLWRAKHWTTQYQRREYILFFKSTRLLFLLKVCFCQLSKGKPWLSTPSFKITNYKCIEEFVIYFTKKSPTHACPLECGRQWGA